MALSESQRASWERTRAKGQRRVILEQWLAGAIIATGGPTLRAFVRNGGGDGVRGLWAAPGSPSAGSWHSSSASGPGRAWSGSTRARPLPATPRFRGGDDGTLRDRGL